jgi:hypothetical protein
MFSFALKNNPNLDKAVITGVQRMAKAGLFSGMNNFCECGVLGIKFATSFGFT